MLKKNKLLYSVNERSPFTVPVCACVHVCVYKDRAACVS